jgi:hypothetical protein
LNELFKQIEIDRLGEMLVKAGGLAALPILLSSKSGDRE